MMKKIPVIVMVVLTLSQTGILISGPVTSVKADESDLLGLEYFDLVNGAFNLTSDELALLEKNGFIVLNRLGTDDLLDAYKYYWYEDLPIIITTDALLQLWHLIFDFTLENSEEVLFYPLLKALILEMQDTFTEQVTVTGDGIATLDTLVYLTVGAKLVEPSVTVPSVAEETVNKILDAIYNEITVFDSIEQFQSLETKRFIDDYTMYRPRGHYTRSENLKSYFRLFKWLSRTPFFFDVNPGWIYIQRSPVEMIYSAIYLVHSMKHARVTVADLGIDASGLEVWEKFKMFLDGIAGETYMVTPVVLDAVISEIEGTGDWHPADLDGNDVTAIQQLVLNDDSIPEPKDPFIIDALIPHITRSPKAMLLFGERLALDTYAGNHLVHPYLPYKEFPNGLEFATTVMQSERAREYLSDWDYFFTNTYPSVIQNPLSEAPYYDLYQEQLDSIQEELDDWPSNEKQAIYWKWIESLRHLTPARPEFGGNSEPMIPGFMETEAWQDEKLTTVLGSWAQLKHDNILYAKQGITTIGCSTPEGYVEPYPRFYNALGQMSTMFRDSITQLESMGLNTDYNAFFDDYNGVQHASSPKEILADYIEIVGNLESIAQHELQGVKLTAEEKEFIRETYRETNYQGIDLTGWLGDIFESMIPIDTPESDIPNTRASLIADIHTSLLASQDEAPNVLEVATGYMEHLVAILPGWDGKGILAVGPVFSYYEFTVFMADRMTDEDWRAVVIARHDETLSQYYDYSNYPRGFWARNYMTSTDMTVSIIYEEGDIVIPALQFQRGVPENEEQPTGNDDSSNAGKSIYSTESRTIVIFSLNALLICISVVIITKIRKFHPEPRD
ncbi:MAG: DUF3160 domain-containing protein [Candidatus Odinarchaeota archaeon]